MLGLRPLFCPGKRGRVRVKEDVWSPYFSMPVHMLSVRHIFNSTDSLLPASPPQLVLDIVHYVVGV